MLRVIGPTFAVVAIALAACTGPTGQQDDGGAPTRGAEGGEASPTEGGGATVAPVDGGGGGGADACALLTEDEISAAYDIEVASSEPTDLLGGDVGCDYTGADGQLLVTTSLFPQGGAAFESLVSSADAEIDLGDGAIWIYNSVIVRKGDATFQVFATASVAQAGNEAELRAAAEDLAELAYDRMD